MREDINKEVRVILGVYIYLFKGSHVFLLVDAGLLDSRSRSLYHFRRLR